MTSHEGQRLADRYELGAALGTGGMAEVVEGHDTKLGRRVAIKLLHADLARDLVLGQAQALEIQAGGLQARDERRRIEAAHAKGRVHGEEARVAARAVDRRLQQLRGAVGDEDEEEAE